MPTHTHAGWTRGCTPGHRPLRRAQGCAHGTGRRAARTRPGVCARPHTSLGGRDTNVPCVSAAMAWPPDVHAGPMWASGQSAAPCFVQLALPPGCGGASGPWQPWQLSYPQTSFQEAWAAPPACNAGRAPSPPRVALLCSAGWLGPIGQDISRHLVGGVPSTAF